MNARVQQLLGFAAITVGLVVTLGAPTRGLSVSLLFAVALVLFACIAGCGLRAWNLIGIMEKGRKPKPRRTRSERDR